MVFTLPFEEHIEPYEALWGSVPCSGSMALPHIGAQYCRPEGRVHEQLLQQGVHVARAPLILQA